MEPVHCSILVVYIRVSKRLSDDTISLELLDLTAAHTQHLAQHLVCVLAQGRGWRTNRRLAFAVLHRRADELHRAARRMLDFGHHVTGLDCKGSASHRGSASR